MNTFTQIAAAASLSLGLAAGSAHAALITSQAGIAGPIAIVTFDGYDELVSSGPENVGAEVGTEVLLTSGPNAVIGANAQALGTNGTWYNLPGSTATVDNTFVASAFATPRGELGFSFATPVAGVGAFFNQYQVDGAASSFVLIAYDQFGNALESATYSIETDEFGYNEGQFLGFGRASADIYGFGVAGGTFVLDNLSFTAPVPEPATWALMLGGVAALLARRRRVL